MQRRILIIDDDRDFRFLIAETLKKLGFEIKEASDGKEALSIINNWLPDLITLDINMPRIDGIEFLLQMRSELRIIDTPVVVISSNSDEETMVQAYAVGATDFIVKPFSPGVMVMKISNLLTLNHVKNEYKDMQDDLKIEKNKLEKNIGFMSRYFSRDFIDAILQGKINSDLGGDTVDASVLFFDLHNSDEFTHRLSPNAFAQMVSELYTRIMDVIFANGGSVNKIIGRSLIATFGCPIGTENDALNSVHTAWQIKDVVKDFNRTNHKGVLSWGIGIATGQVFAGNLGTTHRMEYSVMGDTVNTAARLQHLTERSPVEILIDESTRQKAGHFYSCKKVKAGNLRGKKKAVDIFAVTAATELQAC